MNAGVVALVCLTFVGASMIGARVGAEDDNVQENLLGLAMAIFSIVGLVSFGAWMW